MIELYKDLFIKNNNNSNNNVNNLNIIKKIQRVFYDKNNDKFTNSFKFSNLDLKILNNKKHLVSNINSKRTIDNNNNNNNNINNQNNSLSLYSIYNNLISPNCRSFKRLSIFNSKLQSNKSLIHLSKKYSNNSIKFKFNNNCKKIKKVKIISSNYNKLNNADNQKLICDKELLNLNKDSSLDTSSSIDSRISINLKSQRYIDINNKINKSVNYLKHYYCSTHYINRSYIQKNNYKLENFINNKSLSVLKNKLHNKVKHNIGIFENDIDNKNINDYKIIDKYDNISNKYNLNSCCQNKFYCTKKILNPYNNVNNKNHNNKNNTNNTNCIKLDYTFYFTRNKNKINNTNKYSYTLTSNKFKKWNKQNEYFVNINRSSYTKNNNKKFEKTNFKYSIKPKNRLIDLINKSLFKYKENSSILNNKFKTLSNKCTKNLRNSCINNKALTFRENIDLISFNNNNNNKNYYLISSNKNFIKNKYKEANKILLNKDSEVKLNNNEITLKSKIDNNLKINNDKLNKYYTSTINKINNKIKLQNQFNKKKENIKKTLNPSKYKQRKNLELKFKNNNKNITNYNKITLIDKNNCLSISNRNKDKKDILYKYNFFNVSRNHCKTINLMNNNSNSVYNSLFKKNKIKNTNTESIVNFTTHNLKDITYKSKTKHNWYLLNSNCKKRNDSLNKYLKYIKFNDKVLNKTCNTFLYKKSFTNNKTNKNIDTKDLLNNKFKYNLYLNKIKCKDNKHTINIYDCDKNKTYKAKYINKLHYKLAEKLNNFYKNKI